MSRKGKLSPETKLHIVELVLAGKESRNNICKKYSCAKNVLREWIRLYKAYGPTGLLNPLQNNIYSPEERMQAVSDFLTGRYTNQEICTKYNIRNRSILNRWIRMYNSGRDFAHKMSGGSRMKNSRNTTLEERVQIAEECIANGNNYGEAALKHNVSYQQARSWTKKYIAMGKAGLEDRRGRRIKEQTARTPEEEMKIRIAQLEHENYLLRMERDLLKKVRELEGWDV